MVSKSIFGFKGPLEACRHGAKNQNYSRIRWMNVFLIVGSHAALLSTPFFFTWSAIWASLVLTVIAGMSITFGWHRLLTHRSFETKRPIKLFVTASGCLACQDGPIEWVGTHRIHHRYTDQDGDPHSPKHGLLWAHMGWIFVKPTYNFDAYAKDLKRDRTISFIDRYWFFIPIISLPVLYYIGYLIGGHETGVSWLVIAGCARVAVFYHFTWFVNSFTHKYGYRNFETADDSTNLWWVALLTFGEGWHNNHHDSQRRARHGLRRGEIDMTYWLITFLEKVGLVWNVRRK